MKRTFWEWAGLVLGALLGLTTVQATPAGEEPTVRIADAILSSQQIEADWLRQEDLRERAVAGGKSVSREDDARGGCDGIKTGR